MEIGGYIEMNQYMLPMLHESAIALNLARNCLLYLIKSHEIKKIALPKFLCDSVSDVCKNAGVKIHFYSIGMDFLPSKVELYDDAWLYLVNYYGQVGNGKIAEIKAHYGRVIVDNVQAYNQKPVDGVDTIYTCRKFFGVPDGAFLYTDKPLNQNLEQDQSYKRMEHLLGRYESTASQFYLCFQKNEELFKHLPLRKMSRLTINLLHGIDYDWVKSVRESNFLLLHNVFKSVNRLNLTVPDGAFMYPLYCQNGDEVRKKLKMKKIYIPTLWPNVSEICGETELEYDLARNILPLPVDQRYGKGEMQYLINEVSQYVKFKK